MAFDDVPGSSSAFRTGYRSGLVSSAFVIHGILNIQVIASLLELKFRLHNSFSERPDLFSQFFNSFCLLDMVAGVQAVLYRLRVSYLPQQCMTFLLTPRLVQLIEQIWNRSGFESYLLLMAFFKGVRSSSVAVVSHQKNSRSA